MGHLQDLEKVERFPIMKKIAEQFVFLFDQGVNKKVKKKHFDIRHQFQNSTPCPNGMIDT